jgi:hypothetical protein
MITSYFEKLSEPGILGFYTGFEVTEIFVINGTAAPFNLFTIIVGDESSPSKSPEFLTKNLIQLKLTSGWKLGIQRTWLDRSQMRDVLSRWRNEGIWQIGQQELATGSLSNREPQFVPADGYSAKPWNRILKNNFWNGSYVLELADSAKFAFATLFAKPTAFQELAVKIQEVLPIDLSGFSDRLGNIVIQLPVKAVTSSMALEKDAQALLFHNTWNSLAEPRQLRIAVEAYSDDTLRGYSSAVVDTPETKLPFPMSNQGHRWWLWDDANSILLGASSECSFISSIAFSMNMITGQKRRWTLPQNAAPSVSEEISVNHLPETSVIGVPQPDANGPYTRFRLYREESEAAAKALRFVQYGSANTDRNAEHRRALSDVRTLISRHGAKGVWLWDPYLCATDLLNTLFYSPIVGSELRGLTAGNNLPCEDPSEQQRNSATSRRQDWINDQHTILQSNGNSAFGLNLNFRISFGPRSFPFHDRFLIFPQTDQGALAWSLGTSVNALGRQHHILQQVSDGQLVADAFEQLWNQLDEPQHLVWSMK